MVKFPHPKIDGYLLSPEQYARLLAINKRLYDADAKPFKTDERRDLANAMNNILHSVEQLIETEVSRDAP